MRILDDVNFRWKVIVNAVIIGFSLYVVSVEAPPVVRATLFERFMIDTLSPIQNGITSFRQGFVSFFDDYLLNVNASKSNKLLIKDIGSLKEKIFTYSEMEKENKRLKELLQFGTEINRKKVLAQIVSWDASSDYRTIRINKGLKDGIILQSTVVTSDGLVGYIYRLTQNFADIMTILDSNNKVDGIVKRTRSHGIVEGVSKDRCSMKYVSRTEPIVLNDLVITSGLGNIYPKGIKVGKVARIERESFGIVQNVEIAPTVEFSKLEEVVVLISESDKQKQSEWKALDSQKGDE